MRITHYFTGDTVGYRTWIHILSIFCSLTENAHVFRTRLPILLTPTFSNYWRRFLDKKFDKTFSFTDKNLPKFFADKRFPRDHRHRPKKYRPFFYIHFVAQETRIIRNLFICNFYIKKGRNRRSKFDNQKYISLIISRFIITITINNNYNKFKIQRLHCRPFLMKTWKMNNFLIILVSWATKWI